MRVQRFTVLQIPPGDKVHDVKNTGLWKPSDELLKVKPEHWPDWAFVGDEVVLTPAAGDTVAGPVTKIETKQVGASRRVYATVDVE